MCLSKLMLIAFVLLFIVKYSCVWYSGHLPFCLTDNCLVIWLSPFCISDYSFFFFLYFTLFICFLSYVCKLCESHCSTLRGKYIILVVLKRSKKLTLICYILFASVISCAMSASFSTPGLNTFNDKATFKTDYIHFCIYQWMKWFEAC